MPSAEQAYLFRHALLRDAAYELQLPAERAKLHGQAFHLIEAALGGRAPEPPALDSLDPGRFQRHSTDPMAGELEEHIRLAITGADAAMLDARKLYARRCAELDEMQFRGESALLRWLALAELLEGKDRGHALCRAAGVAYRSGHVQQSEGLFRQAEAISLATGDLLLKARALGGLALVGHGGGRLDRAEQCFEQALAIHRQIGNRHEEARTLGNLAGVYRLTGRGEMAEKIYEQVSAIFRAAGDLQGEGLTLANMAGVYQETGRMAAAEQAYEKALGILRDAGSLRSEGTQLGNLASVYLVTDRAELAVRTVQRALAIARETGNRNVQGVQLCGLAQCLLAVGELAEAREQWQQGTAILREVGNLSDLARHTASMRKACQAAGIPPFDESPK